MSGPHGSDFDVLAKGTGPLEVTSPFSFKEVKGRFLFVVLAPKEANDRSA